jgi:hypothetical protein
MLAFMVIVTSLVVYWALCDRSSCTNQKHASISLSLYHLILALLNIHIPSNPLHIMDPMCDHIPYQSNHSHQLDCNIKQLWNFDGSLYYNYFSNIYTFLPNHRYIHHTLIAYIKDSNKTIVVDILIFMCTLLSIFDLPTRDWQEYMDGGGFSLANYYQ